MTSEVFVRPGDADAARTYKAKTNARANRFTACYVAMMLGILAALVLSIFVDDKPALMWGLACWAVGGVVLIQVFAFRSSEGEYRKLVAAGHVIEVDAGSLLVGFTTEAARLHAEQEKVYRQELFDTLTRLKNAPADKLPAQIAEELDKLRGKPAPVKQPATD